jgi:hypothetical protein
MSGISANILPFRAFFNLESAKNLRGLCQENKVDGLFL